MVLMSNPDSYLKRFKKGQQGLKEFATLLEQADKAHRDMILEKARAEDARFVEDAMRKVVFFEELMYIEETILAELLSKCSPKLLAYAVHGLGEEFKNVVLSQIGFRERRLIDDEDERMGGKTPEGLILGARKQILKIARDLEAKAVFSFELSDCPRFKEAKERRKAG